MIRYFRSIKYAFNGLIYGLRTEKNIQIWLGIALIMVGFSFWLQVTPTEFLIFLIWVFLIGTSEYLNTSIEKLANRVTLEYDEQIKHVKDIAAGATLVASIGAIITGLVIFVPKILEKLENHL